MKRLCSGEAPNIDKVFVARRTPQTPRMEAVRPFVPRDGFNLLQESGGCCPEVCSPLCVLHGACTQLRGSNGLARSRASQPAPAASIHPNLHPARLLLVSFVPAALHCDVPAMAQILMRGADIEFGADLVR
jgi:hypothetical protein